MQSYKLCKTSEIALFPIENELRLLKQENDRSWTTLMKKVLSIVLSGIGTTLLCQDICIPTLMKYIFYDILKVDISLGCLIVLQFFAAVGLFVLFSVAAIKIINWLNDSKDNKKNDAERENLAEFFHKITLNNIITGKSFTKKAENKFNEMQKVVNQLKCEDKQEKKELQEQIKEIKREFCLYLSEAYYYFMAAGKQIEDEKIIESGYRSEYVAYLKEVGVLALAESLLMYEKAVDYLKGLLEGLIRIDSSLWEENEIEVLSIKNGIEKIGEIKKDILNWKTDLNNTIKMINEMDKDR